MGQNVYHSPKKIKRCPSTQVIHLCPYMHVLKSIERECLDFKQHIDTDNTVSCSKGCIRQGKASQAGGVKPVIVPIAIDLQTLLNTHHTMHVDLGFRLNQGSLKL
jgi:hypothetical protein